MLGRAVLVTALHVDPDFRARRRDGVRGPGQLVVGDLQVGVGWTAPALVDRYRRHLELAGYFVDAREHSDQAPTHWVLTSRLVLTPVGPDDLDDLAVLFSDPRVAYWTGPWTRAGVQAWAADMAARWAADGVGKWVARDRLDGSLIGRGGFTRVNVEGETVLELGWAVRDALTGRGYATELGRAAIAWAVEHMPDLPIVAFTEVHNAASRAVMERLGMRLTDIIRRDGPRWCWWARGG